MTPASLASHREQFALPTALCKPANPIYCRQPQPAANTRPPHIRLLLPPGLPAIAAIEGGFDDRGHSRLCSHQAFSSSALGIRHAFQRVCLPPCLLPAARAHAQADDFENLQEVFRVRPVHPCTNEPLCEEPLCEEPLCERGSFFAPLIPPIKRRLVRCPLCSPIHPILSSRGITLQCIEFV